jgi:sugar (glycoside-pentoside-hexuronide) transporter
VRFSEGKNGKGERSGVASVTTGRWTMRFSYTASEVAGQLIFCVISFYLLKFYTDVYGLSAMAAGSILLFARFVDALDAPLWGLLFEKTHSRWGRSRPWFLWLCVPFALFGTLTFCTPHIGPTAKVAYAGVTYVLSSILYTGINTPVTSLLSGLTSDSGERVLLTSFRMFGSKAGVLFVNLTVLPLVAVLGKGNDRRGFMLTMPLYALGTIALYLVAFRNLRENVQEQQQHRSAARSFRALQGNAPWFIIFASSLFFWIAFIARITSAPFFFQYVLHRGDLTPLANSLDFASLGSILALPWLVRRFSKCTAWGGGLAGAVVAQVLVWLGVHQGSLEMVMTGWVLGFLASGIAMAMPFSILSDSVDYGEWKTGVRAAGLLTAVGAAFCLKAGSGLGGALPAWILARCGYVPNVEQSSRSLAGIELSFVWLPAVAYGIALLPVLFYRRFEAMEPRIQQDLQDRRRVAALVSESV